MNHVYQPSATLRKKRKANWGKIARRENVLHRQRRSRCDRAPFFWTQPPNGPQNGVFTILPENGHEHFFTYSVVTDISDDARVVTGSLIAGVRTDGDPPDVAFLWRKDTDMVIVNDLLPQRNPDYYSSSRLSRDGNRVLVTGNPPQATELTTKSLILDLIWPTDH